MATDSFDVVLFDLGGVLVELAGIEQMLAWCPHVADANALWHRWLDSPAVRAYETGAIGRDVFADTLTVEFGLPVSSAVFLAAFRDWPRQLLPGARDVLTALPSSILLASASNTNELHWDRVCNDWRLDRHFHHNFPSHAVGRLKPDIDYFQHVVDALGAAASRILFLDDNLRNVHAAASLGIVSRRVNGPAGARKALLDLHVLP